MDLRNQSLVSLPNLPRVRSLLTKPRLFVVVQDIFLTETAQVADVVLPAAQLGEKTGCFTNVDRTVHISHKAIEPPGESKLVFLMIGIVQKTDRQYIDLTLRSSSIMLDVYISEIRMEIHSSHSQIPRRFLSNGRRCPKVDPATTVASATLN